MLQKVKNHTEKTVVGGGEEGSEEDRFTLGQSGMTI